MARATAAAALFVAVAAAFCAQRGEADVAAPAREVVAPRSLSEERGVMETGAELEAEEEGGEEEELSAEEELEEAAEHFSRTDVHSGCMLLGGVTWVMALFQLVNVDDDDVRRYAWKVISNTISIFMAVLFFQGNNQMLLHYATLHFDIRGYGLTLLQFLHCVVYVAAMFLAVAYNYGAVGESRMPDFDYEAWTVADANLCDFERPVNNEKVRAEQRGDTEATKSIMTDKYGLEVAVVKKKVLLEKRKRASETWSTLLAHMGGFAAIAAGGSMQQSHYFRATPTLSFVPVIAITCAVLCLFQASRLVRHVMRRQATAVGKHKDIRLELVTETVGEAQEDVLALAISFLTTQVVRFKITGQLPNAEGLEEPLLFEPTSGHVVQICGVGVCFVLISIALSRVRTSCAESAANASGPKGPHVEEEGEEPLIVSILDVFVHASAMAFAWCIFAGARLQWTRSVPFGLEVTGLDGRILLALAISGGCFGIVYVLDQIDDTLRGGTGSAPDKSAARAIASVVGAVSVLVGFSWEHCFDGAVSAVVLLSHDKSQHMPMKFLLGLGVFVLLLRPWRKFILKRSMQLDDLKAARDEQMARTAQPSAMPYAYTQVLASPTADTDPRVAFLCCAPGA